MKPKQKIVWWQFRGLLRNLCTMLRLTVRVCDAKDMVKKRGVRVGKLCDSWMT